MTHRDRICRAPRTRLASSLFLAGCLLLFGLLIRGCASLPLMPWHTESLTAGFTARQTDEVRSFEDYLQLEDRLFAALEEKIVAGTETGPAHALVRFSEGSFANPKSRAVNWNRSFEFPAAAEYRKDKRPFQEGATVYPPVEVRTSDPAPPEIPLNSVIARRHSLPASAISAPFQAGGQPVSCRVPPGNSIRGQEETTALTE